ERVRAGWSEERRGLELGGLRIGEERVRAGWSVERRGLELGGLRRGEELGGLRR
ncbi:hypothetical protein J4Q44_G00368250, partial [Coregonus suidteri]